MFKKIYRILNLNPDSQLAQYLLKGTSGGFIIHIFFILISFASSIIITNLISTKEYGRYVYAINWLSILTVVSCFGYIGFITRETAKLKVEQKIGELKAFLIKISKRALLSSIFFSIAFFLFIYFTSPFKETYNNLFLIGVCIIPFWVFVILNQSLLLGSRHVISSRISEYIVRPVLFLVLIIVLYFFSQEINAERILTLQLISLFAAFLVTAYLLYKKENYLFNKSIKASKNIKFLWSASIAFWFISIVSILNTKIDILMIGEMLEEREVGIYNIAARLSDFIKMFLMVVNLTIGPEIASLFQQKKMEKLQLLLRKSIRITFALSLLLACLIVIFGKFVLGFYGTDYIEGYYPLIIMCIAQLINVGLGSVGNVLAMSGHEKYSLYALIISLIINILANFILIPMYGLMGAAIALALSTFVWNFIMWIIIKRKIKINTSVF